MKRIAQLTLATLLALALMLPVAAIANIDGSEPEWTGYAGIRPMNELLTIDDMDSDIEFANDDGAPFVSDEDELANAPNRAQFARSNENDEVPVGIVPISDDIGGYLDIEGINYVGIEPISAETGHGVPVVLVYVSLGIAVLALALAIVALVKKK